MVAHVTEAVEVNHERDGCDHHKHHGRDRIEEESKAYHEPVGKLQPGLIEYNVLKAFAGLADEGWIAAEKVVERSVVSEHEHCAHAECSEDTGQQMAHLLTGKAEEDEHEQGYSQN